MLEQLREHVVAELQQSSRTDTVFVVTAVVFNLVVLAINAGVAGGSDGGSATLWILLAATFIINALAIRGLLAGRQTRNRLLDGLVALYRDEGIDKYYDPALSKIYGSRYLIFATVIAILGVIAIVVPLIQVFGWH